jgi:electron transfer flavoprotein beta subunit
MNPSHDYRFKGGDSLKILALIKISLDVAEIKVDPATAQLRLEGVPEKVGNIDKNAIEAAVRLKEAAGGTVTAVCLGPVSAKESFKDVLAMGADEVYLIEDPFGGKGEAGAVVRILEAAVAKLGPFDLVLTGFASDDGYTYQVAPRLAERLGLPLVSFVRQVSVDGSALKADRDLDDMIQSVQVGLPAVISVAEEAFPPRRTTLMDALKAKKKPVTLWTVGGELGLSADELAKNSRLAASSQTGIIVHRKGQVFKGQGPAELAGSLVDALVADGVLKGGA